MPVEPPADVARWADERAAARAGRDFARADELRARIAAAGWEVVDGPAGSELRPAAPAPGRAELRPVGGFRETFTFYRNADIDLSLRLRALDGKVRRAVAVGADRCRRHAHRAWEATDPEERDRLSRRNMRRVLDKFG